MNDDGQPLYFDYAATTPVDPAVVDAMLPFLKESFGNASSRHARGHAAAAAIEEARSHVAEVLSADPREIVFTSGATESNNLAILGVAASPAYSDRRHVITVRTEHRAVLEPMDQLEQQGFDVTRLGVDRAGRVDSAALESALRPDTLLVSVMHVNNETGGVQDIAAIGALCKARGALFHTDATQSFGKLELDVDACSVDLASLSGHKIHGPQGVGALFVRRKPRVRCEARAFGGGHERGVRPGTLNLAGIVGLGKAAALVADPRARSAERTRVATLRNDLERGLAEAVPEVHIHAHDAERAPGISNIAFAGVDADALLDRLPDLAASTAAACTSAARQPSYVLAALGATDPERRGSVRLSCGRFTTPDDVAKAVRRIALATTALRGEGPPPEPGCEL